MDLAPTRRRLMNTSAAARYLGIAESTLEKARTSGSLDLPFVKAGKRVAYDIVDLDDFIERRKRRTTSDIPAGDALGSLPRRGGAR